MFHACESVHFSIQRLQMVASMPSPFSNAFVLCVSELTALRVLIVVSKHGKVMTMMARMMTMMMMMAPMFLFQHWALCKFDCRLNSNSNMCEP